MNHLRLIRIITLLVLGSVGLYQSWFFVREKTPISSTTRKNLVVERSGNTTSTVLAAQSTPSPSEAPNTRVVTDVKLNTTASPSSLRPTTSSPTPVSTDAPPTTTALAAATATPAAVHLISPRLHYPNVTWDKLDNRFTLPGTWKKHPELSTFLSEDGNACQPEKDRFHPFHKKTHGCCSDIQRENVDSVFWPDGSYIVDDKNNDLNNKDGQEEPIVNLLLAIQGRSLLWVGDSISEQVFGAMEMEMANHNISFHRVKGAHLIFVPSYNATIRVLHNYNVEDPNDPQQKEIVTNGYGFLREEGLIAALQLADVVIGNVGMHHWQYPEYQGRQMQHIQELMEQHTQNRDICFLWRRTLPQHFKSHHGTGTFKDQWANYTEYKQCAPLEQPWVHVSDAEMEKVRKNASSTNQQQQQQYPLLDFTSILQDTYHYHSPSPKDCTHYCYTPLIWSPIMYLTAEAIRMSCFAGQSAS